MSIGAVSSSQILELVKQSTASDQEAIKALRADVKAVEDKKLAFNSIDRALEQLESSLLSLTRSSTYSGRLAATSNENLVTATATSSAARTSYAFSSITQLATSARISSNTAISLSKGTGPTLVSTADINDGTNYDPNVSISTSGQGTTPEIVSGSFVINNVTLNVSGGDTLYTILTKINNSGAGVVATFDDTADTVRISGTTVGSSKTITFSDGTSNLFSALNMSTATAGTDNDYAKALQDVTAFDSVQTGYININNRSIYVDIAQDSLEDIVRRVNNANCGAVMIFDEDTNKVTITNQEEGDPLVLNNDTSGFLNAIKVVDLAGDQDGSLVNGQSTYIGQKAQFTLNGQAMEKDTNTFTLGGVTFTLNGTTNLENPSATVSISANTDATISSMENFVSQFNTTIKLLDDKLKQEGGALNGDTIIRRMKSQLRTDVLAKISNPGQYTNLSEIGFSISKSGDSYALELDTDKLRDALNESEESVQQLFAYDNDGDGLIDDGGYAVTTRSYLNQYTRSVSGYFYKRNDKLDDIIDRMELKIYDKEEKLIDKETRLFDQLVQSITALQDLQQQSSRVSQINSIVMSSLTA